MDLRAYLSTQKPPERPWVVRARRLLLQGLMLGASLLPLTQARAQYDRKASAVSTKTNDTATFSATIAGLPALFKSLQSPSSLKIQEMEKGLRQTARKLKIADAEQIHVADAVKFDIGMALGLNNSKMLKAIFGDSIYNGFSYDMRGRIIQMTVDAPDEPNIYGDEIYTQTPCNLYQFTSTAPSPTVLIPLPSYAASVPFLTLSQADAVVYANTHESWHALDRFTVDDVEEESGGRSINPVLSWDKDTLERKLDRYGMMRETFADIGAVSTMIRRGYGIELIDKIIQWRRLGSHPIHKTEQGLLLLKDYIADKGLRHFRRLSDPKIGALAIDITRRSALTDEEMRLASVFAKASKYRQLNNLSGTREKAAEADSLTAILMAASPDSDTARAVGFATELTRAADRKLTAARMETPPAPDSATLSTLKKWDVLNELCNTAFNTSGAVTPESVIFAYIDMREKLLTEIDSLAPHTRAGGLAMTVQAKMVRLQAVFVDYLRKIDFTGETQKRQAKPSSGQPEGTL